MVQRPLLVVHAIVLAGGSAFGLDAASGVAAGVLTKLSVQNATSGRGYGLWTPTLLALVSAAAAFVAVHIVRRAGAGQPNA